ncbi:MAG: acyltransferase [Kiritimatiellae bacterium]|nr:acyltransferase [Kiritimatiellia bacterium]
MNGRSQAIDGLRTVLNTLIVLHHTYYPLAGVAVGLLERRLIRFQVCITWTLPTLFCLSGYLMMKGYSIETIRHKFWSRCKRLAAPLLLVNWGIVLIVGVGMLFGVVHNPKYTLEWAVRSVFCAKEGTTLATFWYVRTLLIFTAVSPIVYFAIRRTTGQILTIIAVSAWCVASTALGVDDKLWKITPSFAMFSFLTGAVIAIRGKDICQFARKWWLPISIVYLLSLVNRGFGWYWPRNGLLLGLQSLFWFIFADRFAAVMKNSAGRYLCECAFFVFAIHSNTAGWVPCKVVNFLYSAMPAEFLTWPGVSVLSTWIVFAVNLSLCTAMYAAGKKLLPLPTRIMNGRL